MQLHLSFPALKGHSCELSDDLELGKDEVRAKGKSRQEGSEAKVPNDHERCVFTYKLVGWLVDSCQKKTMSISDSMSQDLSPPRDLIEMVRLHEKDLG